MDLFLFYFSSVNSVISLFFIVMLYKLLKKYLYIRDQGGAKDKVRLFILLIFLNWFIGYILNLIHIVLFNSRFSMAELNIYTVIIGLMVAISASLVLYTYGLDILYFTHWIFYIGFLLYNIFTGSFTLLIWYLYLFVGIIVFIIFCVYNGIKLKENKLLGMGVFFILSFSLFPFQDNIFIFYLGFVAVSLYGLVYTMDKIIFFKDKNEEI